MKKISPEAKRRYAEKIKEYRNRIEAIAAHAGQLELRMKSEPETAGYRRLELADENLNQVSYYLLMNSLSVSLLGVKNEGFLNEARKCCYKSVICLEEVVSASVDAPFNEYSEGLERIGSFSDLLRYRLVRKIGFSIDAVKEEYGQNSKWKWSFVELEGRFAAVTKNLINLRTALTQMDPRVEGYISRVQHLDLARKLLQQTADRYREKYELSSLNLEDMRQAINFLSALRRLHILLGEVEQAEVLKKKIEIWKTKMETDQQKLENASRMEKLRAPQK